MGCRCSALRANLHRATSAAGGTQQHSDTFATSAPHYHPACLQWSTPSAPQHSPTSRAVNLSCPTILTGLCVSRLGTPKVCHFAQFASGGPPSSDCSSAWWPVERPLASLSTSNPFALPLRRVWPHRPYGSCYGESGVTFPCLKKCRTHWMVPRLTSIALRHARRPALTSRKSFGRRHPKRSKPSSWILPSPGMLWTLGGVAIFLRPVVRFAVEERSGKFRVIDNGPSGGHNSCNIRAATWRVWRLPDVWLPCVRRLSMVTSRFCKEAKT